MEVFQAGVPFWRGNLHCHTTVSDGAKSPAEVIELYKRLGYDFLAITDHRAITIPEPRLEGKMLLFSGVELDYALANEVVHIVGFGMKGDMLSKLRYDLGPQEGIETIRRFGGRAIVAHPYWSLNTTATLTGLYGVTAAEIYNSVSILRPDSSAILDVAAAHGKLYPLVAADDSHGYEGEEGMSYTMVQAAELTAESIKHAMDEGRFYASRGPKIEQISLAEGRITVRCSAAEHVYFHSNLPWTPGRAVLGNGLQQASYTLHHEAGERFIRCQVIDAQGKSAWGSPIAL